MREQYYGDEPPRRRWILPIIIIGILLLIGAAYSWFTMGKSDLVYPVPPKADFEVIYYTPSPEPVTPTSSPSATPTGSKKKAAATATPKPTAKATAKPTVAGAATESATKATATPTGKTTPSPTAGTIPSATPKPTT